MVFSTWKKDLIKLLKNTSCKRGVAEDCLVVYENRADNLSNNLKLNEIHYAFFQFYCKINRNQLETALEANYGLHPY